MEPVWLAALALLCTTSVQSGVLTSTTETLVVAGDAAVSLILYSTDGVTRRDSVTAGFKTSLRLRFADPFLFVCEFEFRS